MKVKDLKELIKDLDDNIELCLPDAYYSDKEHVFDAPIAYQIKSINNYKIIDNRLIFDYDTYDSWAN